MVGKIQSIEADVSAQVDFQIQSRIGVGFADATSIEFVFSKKNNGFKQVIFNFERGESLVKLKLDKWANEKRIIRVCEAGSQCLVQIHEEHKERFKDPSAFHALQIKPGKTLKDIDFKVETLNDEEYVEIVKATQDIFEKERAIFIQNQKKEAPQKKVASEVQIKQNSGYQKISTIFFNSSKMIIALATSKIVRGIANVMAQSAREEAKRSQENDEHHQIIANEIRKQERKHEAANSDIIADEVKASAK